jgi:hypothetical protein
MICNNVSMIAPVIQVNDLSMISPKADDEGSA